METKFFIKFHCMKKCLSCYFHTYKFFTELNCLISIFFIVWSCLISNLCQPGHVQLLPFCDHCDPTGYVAKNGYYLLCSEQFHSEQYRCLNETIKKLESKMSSKFLVNTFVFGPASNFKR